MNQSDLTSYGHLSTMIKMKVFWDIKTYNNDMFAKKERVVKLRRWHLIKFWDVFTLSIFTFIDS